MNYKCEKCQKEFNRLNSDIDYNFANGEIVCKDCVKDYKIYRKELL